MTTGLFFREYLLKQFSDYRNQSESEVLQYEMEYLIAGKDSDVANLAGVAERMLAIREVANYIYLKGDVYKRQEQERQHCHIFISTSLPMSSCRKCMHYWRSVQRKSVCGEAGRVVP